MDTSHLTRHVGKMANTDQRVVVAFMQIPERLDHALVIPMDNLHPRFEQAIMSVLNTAEGQQPGPFAVVLGRHLMPDTGETIMESLHRQGKLAAVPVHNVLMLPAPNMPMKLSTILEQQGLLQHPVGQNFETEKFNPHAHNQQAQSSENARAVARTLIMEAEDLENVAKAKRAQAYAKDPSLKLQAEKAAWTPQAPAPQVATPIPMANPWTNAQHAPADAASMTDDVSFAEKPVGNSIPNPLEERLARLEELITKLAEPSTEEAPKKHSKKGRFVGETSEVTEAPTTSTEG